MQCKASCFLWHCDAHHGTYYLQIWGHYLIIGQEMKVLEKTFICHKHLYSVDSAAYIVLQPTQITHML